MKRCSNAEAQARYERYYKDKWGVFLQENEVFNVHVEADNKAKPMPEALDFLGIPEGSTKGQFWVILWPDECQIVKDACNHKNRSMNRAALLNIQRELFDGRWKQEAGTRIRIDTNWNIMNGQKRLQAGINTGMPVLLFVVYGCPPEDAALVDYVQVKDAADRWMWDVSGGNKSINLKINRIMKLAFGLGFGRASNFTQADGIYLQKHYRSAFNWFVDTLVRAGAEKLNVQVPVMLALVEYHTQNPVKATEFANFYFNCCAPGQLISNVPAANEMKDWLGIDTIRAFNPAAVYKYCVTYMVCHMTDREIRSIVKHRGTIAEENLLDWPTLSWKPVFKLKFGPEAVEVVRKRYTTDKTSNYVLGLAGVRMLHGDKDMPEAKAKTHLDSERVRWNFATKMGNKISKKLGAGLVSAAACAVFCYEMYATANPEFASKFMENRFLNNVKRRMTKWNKSMKMTAARSERGAKLCLDEVRSAWRECYPDDAIAAAA